MNLPNKLTLLRIFLTILFVFLLFSKAEGMMPAALGVFLFAAITDYWDGKIARQRGEITPLGQLMDPIADKLLTLSAYISFVQMGILPAWMVIVIIARDVLITGLRLSIPQGRSQKTEPRQSGKHKTALQISSIIGVLIFLAVQESPAWRPEWTPTALLFIYYGMFLIVAVTVWSGVRYLVKNRGCFG
ncbi:MAG: CDP-diacylglycerol--glycerol-3-phosphate 3-phosphatidyltransferase [Omnitrophica bacterium RIFCSPHIGHO2_02_FULL_51_18]|nr:MAG: CDP-diacylglycerol--glycerol-3-phosphate 3-phosphatidyltransferase [Omnitrophica bacterium RIFCSPHIGHO2_02_FULL_51_18]